MLLLYRRHRLGFRLATMAGRVRQGLADQRANRPASILDPALAKEWVTGPANGLEESWKVPPLPPS